MTVLDTLRAFRTTARITVPTVLDSLKGNVEGGAIDERLSWWAEAVLREAGATLHVRGRELIPEGEALVVMSNHRSYFDIPAVYSTVPGPLRMVAKKELFQVPLFGRAMRSTGFIEVDRGKKTKAIESLRRGNELLAGGTRVWIAPEGTRTKTGALGPFKAGGFHLALDAKVRILPMALLGTEDVMPPSGFMVHHGATIQVTVLPPIDAPAYGHERRKELMADVRRAIAGALGQTVD